MRITQGVTAEEVNLVTREIDHLIEMLDWNNSDRIQNEAIIELTKIASDDVIREVVLPGPKSRWENAAKVLFNIGYPKIQKHLATMLPWLQDMNWPGANIVFGLLTQVPAEVIGHELELAVLRAEEEQDFDWMAGLKRLVEAIEIEPKYFRYADLLEHADW